MARRSSLSERRAESNASRSAQSSSVSSGCEARSAATSAASASRSASMSGAARCCWYVWKLLRISICTSPVSSRRQLRTMLYDSWNEEVSVSARPVTIVRTLAGCTLRSIRKITTPVASIPRRPARPDI